MNGIPLGARVRLTTDARGAVVSPITGSLVAVSLTLPAGLEGITVARWSQRPPCTHVLITFATSGPWASELWLAAAYLEEIPAEVVA